MYYTRLCYGRSGVAKVRTYLWSSWTPFAGWFWHPAGVRPLLTSSTAESLSPLTADPPWVSSTLANPPSHQCPIPPPHSDVSHCCSLVKKISFKSMVRCLVLLIRWRSSKNNYVLSLLAHGVWVMIKQNMKKCLNYELGDPLESCFRSDLTSSGVYLSSFFEGQVSHGPVLLFS